MDCEKCVELENEIDDLKSANKQLAESLERLQQRIDDAKDTFDDIADICARTLRNL